MFVNIYVIQPSINVLCLFDEFIKQFGENIPQYTILPENKYLICVKQTIAETQEICNKNNYILFAIKKTFYQINDTKYSSSYRIRQSYKIDYELTYQRTE